MNNSENNYYYYNDRFTICNIFPFLLNTPLSLSLNYQSFYIFFILFLVLFFLKQSSQPSLKGCRAQRLISERQGLDGGDGEEIPAEVPEG